MRTLVLALAGYAVAQLVLDVREMRRWDDRLILDEALRLTEHLTETQMAALEADAEMVIIDISRTPLWVGW